MTKTRILIAAPTSGCGKTTVTMGLLRALRKRGIDVQPFKCGPDYIDTKWQTLAAGRPSVNLDPWMLCDGDLKDTCEHYSQEAQATLTEGAMGLFDGYEKWHGSAAEVAMLTEAHIVLVVDARSAAFSVAATILGTDTLLRKIGAEEGLAGVIFNKVGSASHCTFLAEACQEADVRCLGFLPRADSISLPSRHLGLTIDACYQADTFLEQVASFMEEHVDIDMLLDICTDKNEYECTRCAPLPVYADDMLIPGMTIPKGGRIALAHDDAFNFCYERNEDLLRSAGHEVVYFSPLNDDPLPAGTALVYLPGGYPELHLKELEENMKAKMSLREYVEKGGRVYAECGGMLYLSQYIEDQNGERHQMAGILPLHATFVGMHLHLGYRKMETDGRCWRGHEFHYSEIHEDGAVERIGTQKSARGKETRTAIYKYKNVVAGYTHFTFGGKK